MKKLALLLALVCLGCLLAAPAASQARNLYFGISANSRSGDDLEEIEGIQDSAAETGAGWLREDLEWWRVEPSEGSWDWSHYDDLFLSAAERGMKILPILNSPPCWAVPKETLEEDCGRTWPESNGDYAYFTARAVERYGPSGDFWDAHPLLDNDLAPRYWEVWNESYLNYFTNDDVDPARYAALYKAAVIAGRGANGATDYLIQSTDDAEVGPKEWVDWAEALVEAEPTLGNYIDGIAVHPYPESNDPDYLPENGTDASFRNTDINYENWREQGINKPVWITEVGYSACEDEADDCVPGETFAKRQEQKAEWLTEIFDELGEDHYAFVHAVFLYNLQQGGDPEDPDYWTDNENWFGILDQGGSKLPAWYSFATAIEEYEGTPVPNTFITGKTITPTTAEFTFGVNDETSSLDCQLDSGAWTPCTSPQKYTEVGPGSHTFRVRATNAEATESGPATHSWSSLPTATTGGVSNLKATAVTLNGSVNPQGSSTTYQFEYGTTTSYGNVVPVTPKSAGSGSGAVNASVELSGLSAGTLYHYRVVATNAGGTTKGADMTFAIAPLTLRDNLQREELPLATGNWSKAKWAGEIGGAWNSGGYLGFGSNSASVVTTAYWNPTTFSDSGAGDMVAATVGSGSAWASEYLAVWLNMPEPSKAQSGYEARFSGVTGSASNYKVELSKWVSGTRTILASTSGFSLPVGTTIALGRLGGQVTLWTGTSANGLSPLLTAADSTYSSGYAGLEVYGVGGTLYDFKAG
ncbi:MAG TPA: fibronectin type III domain-containing protein [Solirubrobacterales bacterium]